MGKIDFKKELKQFYRVSPRAVVQIIVPPLRYLMIDGRGDPNSSPEYSEAIEALFSVSYAAKFAVKKGARNLDYAVMPLEGLWWADDWAVFEAGDKSKWNWTMMIMQPAFVTRKTIETAIADVRKRRNPAALPKLRWEKFSEGRCAQILHVGPFSTEGATIEKLHEYILGRGSLAGKHHEIYLSDIRRADPAKWKTILRQPMK